MRKIPLEKVFAGILLALPLCIAFAQERLVFFGIPWYVPEILVFLAGALFVVLASKDEWYGWIRSSFGLATLLILVGVALSAMMNDMTPHGYGRIKSWILFPTLYGGLVSFSIRRGLLSARDILASLFVGGTLVGLITIFFIIQGGAFSYDDRLRGQFLSANHLAMMLAPGVIAGALLTWSRTAYSRYRSLFFFGGTAFLFVLIVLSQSYAVIGALLMTYFFALFFARGHKVKNIAKWLFLGVIIFVLGGLSLNIDKLQSLASFDERSSLASRIMIWQSALRIASDHPTSGIGPGNFQKEYLEYQKYFPPYLEWSAPHPHNMFLDILLEAGTLGLLGLSLLMAAWIFFGWKCLKAIKNGGILMMSPLLFGVYFLLVGLVDVPFLLNGLAYSFILAAALSQSLFSREISDRSSHHDD